MSVFASSFARKLEFPAANLPGLALFIAVCAASIPIFWIGFVSLAEAWTTPEYSHGPLIPHHVGLFLFLRNSRPDPNGDGPAAGPLAGRRAVIASRWSSPSSATSPTSPIS